MRPFLAILAVSLIAPFAVGCGSSSGQASAPPEHDLSAANHEAPAGGDDAGDGGAANQAPTCPDGGCTPAPSTPPAADAAAPTVPDASDGGVCPHVGAPVLDPNTLPACGGANSGAHCLPSAMVPSALTSQLAACTGGSCVPDKIIAAGGQFIPATCSSVGGAEGRCVNTVIPKVGAQPALPQATCDADERCAPCFDPSTGADTGVCRTSCDPGPAKAPTALPACCGGLGKCAPASAVPASQKSFLNACDTQTLCVPIENMQPTFRPQPCTVDGFLGIGSYDGVCLSSCLNFGPNGDQLEQGDCDALHTCVPCINPIDDTPTHAPGCGF